MNSIDSAPRHHLTSFDQEHFSDLREQPIRLGGVGRHAGQVYDLMTQTSCCLDPCRQERGMNVDLVQLAGHRGRLAENPTVEKNAAA